MAAPFDQALHSNNSNVDKHINTRKFSIKQSPLSRPFYLTCTNLMRREKKNIFNRKQQTRWQFTGEAAQYYVASNHSDILQWIEKLFTLKYISMGYGYACVEKSNDWKVSSC